MRSLCILIIVMAVASLVPWDALAGTGYCNSSNGTIDFEGPAITLLGNASVTVECKEIYSDEGATAYDACGDVDVSENIVATNPVNTNVAGVYTVRYNVTDILGNTATEMTRTVTVQDTLAPEISRTGNASVTVECKGIYTDLGATAEDAYDGNLTTNIVVTNPVNVNSPGIYTVRYNVSDAAGNAATEVTRMVTVQDPEPPVINRPGNASVTMECRGVYTDVGATAVDACDGDLTSSIVTTNPVNSNTPGVYTVRYNVSDIMGNTATEVTRTVTVQDTTAPTITSIGSGGVTKQCGYPYTDAGATAVDSCDGNLTSSIVVTNPVNTSTPGEYLVLYNVSDAAGNAATEVTRTVTVKDTAEPLIFLTGEPELIIQCRGIYSEKGATALDFCGGNLTSSIVVTNPVNTSTPGEYLVRYNVSDAAGNAAIEVTRSVTVMDPTVPIITQIGSASVVVECKSAYTDAGATAADACDGNLTSSIVTTNPVDINTPGVYTIRYNVSDAAGNTATAVTRKVIVQDTIAPVIALTGNVDVTIQCGQTYSDAGAMATDACRGDLTSNITVTNPVLADTPGIYTVRYNVSDAAGNAAIEVTRTVTVQDTLAPEITRTGAASLTVICKGIYTDAGATAMDACEGNLSSYITTTNPVNTNILGVYTIRYNISDSAGNTAAEVMRMVTIEDTPPVITRIGAASLFVECKSTYIDAGATAEDVCSGENLTTSIVIINPVNTNTPGVYTVRYNVSDATGNTAAEVTRMVKVQDTRLPIITRTGAWSVTIECKDPYTDPGATAADACDGNLSSSIVTTNPVNTNTPGIYTIQYDVSDAAGNTATEVYRMVTVAADRQAPTIMRNGSAALTLECGNAYSDAGATASDTCDPSVPVITGGDEVMVNIPGVYNIVYNAVDDSGNPAVPVSRTVTVEDTLSPSIILTGGVFLTVNCKDVWTDPGATATDACDGNLTSSIVTTNPVNTNTPGVYTIRYNVSDISGHAATEVTRMVTVRNNCATEGEGEGAVCTDACDIGGVVTNSLTGAPIQGVNVEISASIEKSLAYTFTDRYGHYLFEALPNASGPYDLSFSVTEYAPQYLTNISAANLDLNVALVPRGITRPKTASVLSAPRAMYVDWMANPEYNVKGYNVWRTQTDVSGSPLGDAIKLNGNPANVYDGILTGVEYVDSTVQKGLYYTYQIQAISGADRPSLLSGASYPPAKGQWLTVFFPEIAVNNAGVFLWDNPGNSGWVTLPLCSRCAYNVSTSGIDIRAYLPSVLVNADQQSDIKVSLTGITSGMTYDYNILPVSGDPDRLELFISSADLSVKSLYGAGTLFNVSVQPKPYDGCGKLELIEDVPSVTDGVRLYDDGTPPSLIDLELEDGRLCSDGACTHGDVNMDGNINAADVDYILALAVKLVSDNACSAQAGDINLDGRVDSADAVMILRWLKGMNIAPPDTKSEELASVSFAAASVWEKAVNPPLVEIQRVSGQVGTPIDVPVIIQNATQMAGCQMRITFPEGTEGVVYNSVTPGALFSGWHLQSKHTSDGDKGYLDVALNGDSACSIVNETTLLTLRFDIYSNTDRTIPIRMSSFNVTDQYGFEPRFDAPLAPTKASGAIVVGIGGGEGEGEGEGEGVTDIHSADTSGDHKIQLQELLRVIQFFNMGGYSCDASGSSADGYTPGVGTDHACTRHGSDYDEMAWKISLQELLRLIQFFNMGGYHACSGEGTADGYCPGLS